jgi:hypothetical protein
MRLLSAVMLVGSLSGVAVEAQETFGTAQEAEAMVGRAVSHIKAVGAEKAYQDFTNKTPGFFDRDLYVVVYDLGGRVLAHGGNRNMVGKELLGMRDADGKPFVKERVELPTRPHRKSCPNRLTASEPKRLWLASASTGARQVFGLLGLEPDFLLGDRLQEVEGSGGDGDKALFLHGTTSPSTARRRA